MQTYKISLLNKIFKIFHKFKLKIHFDLVRILADYANLNGINMHESIKIFKEKIKVAMTHFILRSIIDVVPFMLADWDLSLKMKQKQ